jgi:hypothetical protein
MLKKILICLFTLLSILAYSQEHPEKLNRKTFFEDQRPLDIVLSTDIRSLRDFTPNPSYQPATIDYVLPDSTRIHEQIRLRRRGKFRNENCYLASLMIDFAGAQSPRLSPLKKLKWVGGCSRDKLGGQLLLKEYLVYKIYNLLTDMSFRVRLVRATYRDTASKVKPYSQYAFMIEDTKDLAKRNKCMEKTGLNYHPETANRKQMTLIALFQYMIGNTDWSVAFYHNIKLLVPKQDTLARPYPVPYDFDYCGFVNAPYAIPPDELGIPSVTTRLYRGHRRSMEELEEMASLFMDKQQQILDLIEQCEPLDKREKTEIKDFLEPFFETIKSRHEMEKEFVENAQ